MLDLPHAVPPYAVVAVREQSKSQRAPYPGQSKGGDRSRGVPPSGHPFHHENAQGQEESCDRTDGQRSP